MNRKGPSGSRHFGKRKGDKSSKIVKRNVLSIQGRSLRFVATPLIVVFVFVRSIAYQFFLAVVLVAHYSRRIFAFGGSRYQLRELEPCGTNVNSAMYKGKEPLGPGEPALATQKKHHRKAFEYISKALKIDEEDGSEYFDFWCDYICFLRLVGSVSVW